MFRLGKTQKPTRVWVQGSRIYARVAFLGLFCAFSVFGRPQNLRERGSRGQNLRSRRFWGLFCSCLVFAIPQNLRERGFRGQSLRSVGFRPYSVFFYSLQYPKTYASVGPGVKKLRSRRVLALFCSFLVFARPTNLRERGSRG